MLVSELCGLPSQSAWESAVGRAAGYPDQVTASSSPCRRAARLVHTQALHSSQHTITQGFVRARVCVYI